MKLVELPRTAKTAQDALRELADKVETFEKPYYTATIKLTGEDSEVYFTSCASAADAVYDAVRLMRYFTNDDTE